MSTVSLTQAERRRHVWLVAATTVKWSNLLHSTNSLCFSCASHVAVGPDQIGLVAADNRTRANHRFKFRAVGASSSGLRSSFAARTVGDLNQLPAVVLEQESPAAFKNQLDRLAPVACRRCRNAPPPAIGVILHEVCQLLVKTRRQDKASLK